MKEYITNGIGSAQTLENSNDYKIPVYATQSAIVSDINNLSVNEIVANKENVPLTLAEGAQPAITTISNYFNTSLNDSGWQTVSGLSLQNCPVPNTDWGNLSVAAWRKNNKVMIRGSIRMGTGFYNTAYDWVGDGVIAIGLPTKYRPRSEVTCFVYGYGEYDPQMSEAVRSIVAAFSTFGIDSNGRITIHNYNAQAASYSYAKYILNFEMFYTVN